MQARRMQLGLILRDAARARPSGWGEGAGAWGERRLGAPETPDTNKKGPTCVGPPCRAYRPDPVDPGGLGAEESGTEGPGQRTWAFSQCRAAVA